MRAIAIIIVILGLAAFIFGILFVTQGAAGKQEVADSLTAPVTLDNLEATYDALDMKVKQMSPTDPMYLMYFAQRTSMGLAKANAGTASAITTSGVVDILLGLGVVLAGIAILRKSQSDA